MAHAHTLQMADPGVYTTWPSDPKEPLSRVNEKTFSSSILNPRQCSRLLVSSQERRVLSFVRSPLIFSCSKAVPMSSCHVTHVNSHRPSFRLLISLCSRRRRLDVVLHDSLEGVPPACPSSGCYGYVRDSLAVPLLLLRILATIVLSVTFDPSLRSPASLSRRSL